MVVDHLIQLPSLSLLVAHIKYGFLIIWLIFWFSDVNIPDDGTDDPFDFKFVRWMTREKVIKFELFFSLFSNKMSIIRAGIPKLLVQISNDQTAASEAV